MLGVDFNNEMVFEQTIAASNGIDNALIKLAGDGTTLWVRPISGNGNEFSEGLLATGGNNPRIVFTGWFTNAFTVGGMTTQSQGQDDLFITIHTP